MARVRELGVEHELLDAGLDELAAVIEGCADLHGERFVVEANLRIARGLDYYTGTVFEIFMAGFESLGSVGGGGRYDALATDGTTTYPGVGISFGISRTLVPLFNRGELTGSRSAPSVVLVALVDEELPRRQRQGRRRVARARHPEPRSPPARRSTAGRFATPNAAASRSSGSLGTDEVRTPGEGHPQR